MKLIVLVGPTASGKSAVALELAKKIRGEIVNADSRQIYQYLNVATAKPSQEERKEVPHHLYDFLNPKKTYSAGEYAEEAAKTISEIFSRKHIPILVGGTGFYLRALFDGLPKLPKRDESFRRKLLLDSHRRGNDEGRRYLHEQLKQVDPLSAKKIPYQNIQRVIRALEVYHLTGKPISSYLIRFPARWPAGGAHPPIHFVHPPLKWAATNDGSAIAAHAGATIKEEKKICFCGLRWERETLNERIRIRTEKMIPALIQETKELLQRGYSEKDPGLQSVGYRETIEYLQGKISYEMLLQKILQRTHQYAKRQMTWFKPDNRICWMEIQEPFQPNEIASRILDSFSVML